jgi:hypothetical protein
MTTVAAVAIWPLAAGLALVIWTRVRAAQHARRLSHVDQSVRGMFRAVELQPTPDRLALVVDALEERDAIAAAAAGGRRQRTSARV